MGSPWDNQWQIAFKANRWSHRQVDNLTWALGLAGYNVAWFFKCAGTMDCLGECQKTAQSNDMLLYYLHIYIYIHTYTYINTYICIYIYMHVPRAHTQILPCMADEIEAVLEEGKHVALQTWSCTASVQCMYIHIYIYMHIWIYLIVIH